MRLCSASCDARSSSLSIGICWSSATGLWSSSRQQHRIELAEQARRVVVPAPPEVLRERRQPLVRGRDELPERARLADDRRELRAGHRQHPHVVGAEGARLDRLHDEHALQQAAIDDRHAEERAVGILAGLGKVLEARMRVAASATNCGRSCSATRPARPSVSRMRTRPTLSARRPMVAASTRLARSGSSR